jgi:hypothetical protein
LLEPTVRVANLGLKFLLELAAFAALAYWGADISVVVAIAAPAVAIVLWAVFAAPKSAHRLPAATRIPFELLVFAAAVAALLAAGVTTVAIVLALLVAVNAILLTVFDQWEA